MAISFRRTAATAELVTASALWGFGFIATIWAFEVFSAFELTFLRFALASTLILFLLFFAKSRKAVLSNLKISFIPAFLLCVTLIFQTWGLHYTTPTKSGFITTLYVIFVPILESLLSNKKLPGSLWLCVATALIGTALIVNIGVESLNIGDLLTFICALAATVQIYWLGIVSPQVRQPFAFNLMQAFWGALLSSPVFFFEPLAFKIQNWATWTPHAWVGLLLLTFGSTVIAFFLQVRAQAYLSPTVSSLIFLLESPFALLFALLFLGQSLSGVESLGAVLIFMSAVAASLIEARRKRI